MVANVRIHPKAQELLAHNTRVRAIDLLIECVGTDFTAIEVANILADALGDALATCVLHGATQADLDAIGQRKVAIYNARLAPFYRTKEE